jgi:hypothetical protein
VFLPLAVQSKNEEFHMEITNNAEFQIGVFEIDDAHLKALVEFTNAFDLSFHIEALTEPDENRQGLRLPYEDGVVITISGETGARFDRTQNLRNAETARKTAQDRRGEKNTMSPNQTRLFCELASIYHDVLRRTAPAG